MGKSKTPAGLSRRGVLKTATFAVFYGGLPYEIVWSYSNRGVPLDVVISCGGEEVVVDNRHGGFKPCATHCWDLVRYEFARVIEQRQQQQKAETRRRKRKRQTKEASHA